MQDHKWFDQIVRLARARDAVFYPVRVLCDAAELKKRKAAPERRLRLKETDISDIEGLLKHNEVLKIDHRNLLTLDVSDLTAEQSADAVLEHVRKRHAD